MKTRNVVLSAGVVALLAGTASADYTFPLFNVLANTTPSNPQSVNLNGASVPAGVYLSYEVRFDWGMSTGDAWSNEAVWALVNDPVPFDGPEIFFADPGPSPAGQSNTTPRPLTWSGLLDAPYTGGTPLHFWFAQTFGGSGATWSNVQVTLKNAGATPPPATSLGVIGPGMTMTTGALGGNGEIDWYSFTIGGITGGAGDFLTIDTFGSTLMGGSFGNGNDSEIGLYSSSGALIATNDDFDFGGGNLLSFLGFGAGQSGGDLAAGTYYLAVGGFNTTFGPGFGVTSDSPVNGNYKLTITTNVPAPGALALVGMAVLVGVRRRRA
jgi:MYXO-CTERM domain-containing protein